MSTGGTLFWTAVAAAGAALIATGLLRADLPAVAAAEEAAGQRSVRTGDEPADAIGNGFASQALRRSPDGHFYAEAQVNGARIRLMIDTGASVVALTPADAQRAGIMLGSERVAARGAGGEVQVVPVTIDRIAVGPLSATQVRGAVAEGLPVSLLGQSFLSRAASVEIRGDRMVLR